MTTARRKYLNAILAIAVALASYGLLKNAAHRAIASANPNARSEISRLAEEMQWKPGMTIADIGAGDGSYSFATEKIVGRRATSMPPKLTPPSWLRFATKLPSKN